jgi:hypothetical protein
VSYRLTTPQKKSYIGPDPLSETFTKHAFLPNPPEADKFLRLPREMLALLNPYLTFNRGEAYFSGVTLKF